MLRALIGSVLVKLILIGLVFLIVPMILYQRFAAVDTERQQLLMTNLQYQGRLLAQSLELVLRAEGDKAPIAAAGWVERLGAGNMRVKLLLRPALGASGGASGGATGGTAEAERNFFYVAASPAVDAAYLDAERTALVDLGLLPKLAESCEGNRSLSQSFKAPSGTIEILTSISPFHTQAGCWAIITAYGESDPAGESLVRPFADAPEVRAAAIFYGVMAVLLLAVTVSVTLGLQRFAKLARDIRRRPGRRHKSFADATPVPEFKPIAAEMDGLVATLDASARSIREAAEENAHAIKAPIAAVAQAVEPIRRVVIGSGDPRASRAVETIERALERLEDLVAAARRIDEAIAEMIDTQAGPIDLSSLVVNTARAFSDMRGAGRVGVLAEAEPGIKVSASEEALETALENLVDNAVSFAPSGTSVRLRLKRNGTRAELSVVDEGPGVPAELLPLIFERNVSLRPRPTGWTKKNGVQSLGQEHFGLGLAIVRRNVQLMGGQVAARNRPEGGFEVLLHLPLA